MCIYSYEKDKAFFENWYLIFVLRIIKKISGLLQSAEIPLSTLEISGCWFLPFSSRLIFDYKGEETPKSLFQNQWATSAPLLSMPYKLQRPYSKQGLSVYARGCNPSPLPPQIRQYGQFSHISTCIIFCTSHNWSMTVTSCIRCFSIYFLHRFYVINGT